MSTKNSLELKGIIRAYPIPELALEVAKTGLSGSLRAERGEHKTIIYFADGKAVYAVSNQRVFRLAEILLNKQVVDREFLAERSRISNDLQLAETVVDGGILSNEEIVAIIASLCESVVASVFSWTEGDWTFSPHARFKAGLSYPIDLERLLLDHARSASAETAGRRLPNPNEWFGAEHSKAEVRLDPHEAFIMSRLDSNALTLDQLVAISGLPRAEAIRNVYVLWLGGFLSRYGWAEAFSEERVSAIRSANFEIKRPSASPSAGRAKPPEPVEGEEIDETVPSDVSEFTLDEILARVEAAQNYYEILGIDPSAKVVGIRKAYFRLAKILHPDRYHNEIPELLLRVERAFTELAQAHETLKSPESRQGYDIRLRQSERDKERGEKSGVELSRQEDQAANDFERGFALQLDGKFDAAVPYLARAVHYAPKNARYHAYYGKALSVDDSQRHKAENELLTAVRLEPSNDAFKLLLVEFFVRYKLIKRAEGELTRLLQNSPSNREAQVLLDSLQRKSLN